MLTPLKVILALVLTAYPVIVFIGFKYTTPLTTNIFIIIILAVRLIITRRDKNPINTISFFVLILMVIICSLGVVLKEFELALLYPVFFNLALFLMFLWSLSPGRVPVVETLARIKEKFLSPKAIQYVRRVTILWATFFIINGAISLYTYLYCSVEQWTLYNGLISYIFIGAIGALEYLVRITLRKRWNKLREVEFESSFLSSGKVKYRAADFIKDQQKVKKFIEDQENAARVIITSTDSYRFACAFMAVSELGHELVMLPNYQVKTLEEYSKYYDFILSDEVLDSINSSAQISPKKVTLKLASKITMFTSGSQSEPKVVAKSLLNLVNECDALDLVFNKLDSQAIFIGSVSHHHIYGLLIRVLWPLLRKSHIAVDKIEYPEQLEKLPAVNHSQYVFISSPAFLKRLDSEIKNKDLFGQMSVFSSGGALSADGARRSLEYFGSSPFEIYGSTETGGIAWRVQSKSSSPWSLLPSVTIAKDSRDCLKVMSSFVFEGEFQTSDKVEILGAGEFLLLGRVDRTVKIEEKRLSLDQLESKLKQNPNIKNAHCVVFEVKGRVIIGCLIVLNEQNEWKSSTKIAKVKALKTYLLQYFEPVLLPKKYRFLEQLPYNAQSKLVRSTVLGYFDETSRNEL